VWGGKKIVIPKDEFGRHTVEDEMSSKNKALSSTNKNAEERAPA
jgi:hypothetical protein